MSRLLGTSRYSRSKCSCCGAPVNNAIDANALAATGTPLGYAGLPADITAGIVYLASDDSRYVTGSELVIDGGMTAG